MNASPCFTFSLWQRCPLMGLYRRCCSIYQTNCFLRASPHHLQCEGPPFASVLLVAKGEARDFFFYLTYVIDLCPQQYANCLKTNNTKIHSFKKNKPKLYWYKTACVLNMSNIIHTAFIPLCACFTPSPFQVGYNHSSSAWKECTHKTDILK